MSLLSKLETRLESAVEGLFNRAFRDRVQPLEIAQKIEKRMQESKILSVEGAYVPNRFKVRLSPVDYDYLAPLAGAFVPELEKYIGEFAEQIGCRLADEPSLVLVRDESLKSPAMEIETEISNTPPAVARKVRGRRRGSSFLLEVIDGPDEGREFEVREGTMIIGRHESCDIPLTDPSASRHHARLVCKADGVMIEDLQSTNGTLVNNERVKHYSLLPGDVISIGTTTLRLKVVDSI
jgi:hypothetical protein